ncbi:hypothetical protein HCA55_02510 [Listeria booriae]|uniref:YkyB-like protein n=1 Tax=Listeria booriae TaxID=1552123 RepID=A0A842AV16_9LIST|nr:YkyB family protein [Listeria booriae]MBC1795576.1 hypothetical protein [Listeria booriae]MBC1811372.1 hypothetical protein [Listeria booriae]
MSDSSKKIAEAIFIVNRHSKAATDPRYLYRLKKAAIEKLIQEGQAKKLGLQYSNNPKKSYQHSNLLIGCHGFLFHLPPQKQDMKDLPHLGTMQPVKATTQVRMSLSHAKSTLENYTGVKPDPLKKSAFYENASPYFR